VEQAPLSDGLALDAFALDAIVVDPFGQVRGDVARPVVEEQARSVPDPHLLGACRLSMTRPRVCASFAWSSPVIWSYMNPAECCRRGSALSCIKNLGYCYLVS